MIRILKILSIALIQSLVLFQGNVFSASYDSLIVDQDFDEIQLGKYVRYLSDSTNQMDLASFIDVSSPTVATLSANLKNEVALGYGQNQYWFQFKIHNNNDSVTNLFLNIAYPNLDHFVVYQKSQLVGYDSIVKLTEMGDNFHYGNKIRTHRNYIVPITLEPHQSTDFIFQIKKQWEPVNFPLILANEYHLVRRTNNDNLFLGVYFGVHMMFAFTLLALFFFSKNNFFLLYLTLNVLNILNFLSDTGIGLQYIWPTLPLVQKLLPYIITFGSIILHITFIRVFFRTSLHLIRFNQFLLALMWLVVTTVVLLIAFALIFPNSNLPFQIGYNIVNGIYLGYGLVILSLCLVTLVQIRRKEVIWITIAVLVQFSNWIIHIIIRGNALPIFLKGFSIYDWNLFPSHISTPHISIILMLMEILVVTIILVLSFYSFIKDNSSSEYKLMMLSKNTINAYIEGQEKERVKLTERINDSISQDVDMLEQQINFTLQKIDNPVVKSKLLAIGQEVGNIKGQINKITTDFVPSEYFNKSFYDAVKSIFAPLSSYQIQVKYNLAVPSPKINDFAKVNVCRILQEIVGNISKHANATLVQVKIYYQVDLVISIQDNGSGFDKYETKGGIGLLNIQSRVNGMNGQLSVDSEIGKGTLMTIKIPLKELA